MKRKPHTVPFARMRLLRQLNELTSSSPAEWPKHLRLAHGILVDELKLDCDKALGVTLASYSAAHDCARSIDDRTRRFSNIRCRDKLRKFFLRAAKCTNRLPALQRHALDRKLAERLDREPIDSESID